MHAPGIFSDSYRSGGNTRQRENLTRLSTAKGYRRREKEGIIPNGRIEGDFQKELTCQLGFQKK